MIRCSHQTYAHVRNRENPAQRFADFIFGDQTFEAVSQAQTSAPVDSPAARHSEDRRPRAGNRTPTNKH